MPCHARMKKRFLQDLLLLLYLLKFGFMVTSLNPGYLDFDNLPDTNFSCVGKVIGGYYADLETSCQMFHVCTIGQLEEPMDIRFLCLNGTVFDQETRVCERIDEVDCSKSEQFYSLNLELYGNTQPPIVEESSEKSPPPKPTSTTTTTTTTPKPSVYKKPTQAPFYTTPTPLAATAAHSTSKVISSHHFPVGTSSDIRFNPEEININLKAGQPPEIRGDAYAKYKTQQQSNSQIHVSSQVHVTTQAPKNVVNYGLTHAKGGHKAATSDVDYGFAYHRQQQAPRVDYRTEAPQHSYQYHPSYHPQVLSGPPYQPQSHSGYYKSSTYRNDYHNPTTKKSPYHHPQPSPTTFRSSTYNYRKTEKPQRIQIPLPLLPSVPPLTFSSPAPFTITHHVEAKRYTSEQQQHHSPRIIISASASVSDASGRRLNYSLGSIEAAHLFEQPPASYDDYKEGDVGLDPFYHDVPKIKSPRRRRSAQKKGQADSQDIGDEDAADVLKFLFDWYTGQEKPAPITIPVTASDITEINEQLSPLGDGPKTIEGNAAAEDATKAATKREDLVPEPEEGVEVGPNPGNSIGLDESTTAREDLGGTSSAMATEGALGPSNHTGLPSNEDYYDFVYEDEDLNMTLPDTIKKFIGGGGGEALEQNGDSALENESAILSGVDYIDDNYEPLTYKEAPYNGSATETETKASVSDGDPTPTTLVVVEDPTEGGVSALDEGATTQPPVSVDDEVTSTGNGDTGAFNVAGEGIETTAFLIDEETEASSEIGSGIETTTLEMTTTTTQTTQRGRRGRIRLSKPTTEPEPPTTSHGDGSKATSTTGGDLETSTTEETLTTTQALVEETTIVVDPTTTQGNETLDAADVGNATVPSPTPNPTLETRPESDLQELGTFIKNIESTTKSVAVAAVVAEKTQANATARPTTETTLDVAAPTTTPTPTTLGSMTSQLEDGLRSTTVEAATVGHQSVATARPWPRGRGHGEARRRRPSPRHRFKASRVETQAVKTGEEATTEALGRHLEGFKFVERDRGRGRAFSTTTAALAKSADATQAERTKEYQSTTPLSRLEPQVRRHFIFNCFGKALDRFYSDPRDCRLFHYCTPGYSRNQILDMKFVCDYGTYFDDARLICTKLRPPRCL